MLRRWWDDTIMMRRWYEDDDRWWEYYEFFSHYLCGHGKKTIISRKVKGSKTHTTVVALSENRFKMYSRRARNLENSNYLRGPGWKQSHDAKSRGQKLILPPWIWPKTGSRWNPVGYRSQVTEGGGERHPVPAHPSFNNEPWQESFGKHV